MLIEPEVFETYECASCHGTFVKGWDDKPTPGTVLVCDPCYEKIVEWAAADISPDTARRRC